MKTDSEEIKELRKFILESVKKELGHISIPKPFKYGSSFLEITSIHSDGDTDYIYNNYKGNVNIKTVEVEVIKSIAMQIKENKFL